MVSAMVNERNEVVGAVAVCICSCNVLTVKSCGDYVSVSCYQSGWYEGQAGAFLKDVRKGLRCKLNNRPYYAEECILSVEDMEDLVCLMGAFSVEEGGEAEVNHSDLVAEYIPVSERYKDGEYAVKIRSKLSVSEILAGKSYYMYEILYTKKEWEKVVRQFARYMEAKEEKYS